MKTILLLFCSNIFMTMAWYGHLKYRNTPLILAILASWGIALLEYCFQVPANRFGYGQFTAFQLKIIQEVITLTVFIVFAWLYLGEQMKWNYAVSFLFILGAVAFAFWGKLWGAVAGGWGILHRALKNAPFHKWRKTCSITQVVVIKHTERGF